MRGKKENLSQKDIGELKTLLDEKRRELVKLRFELELKKLKNVHKIKSVRKEIARILTIINEKELTRKEQDKR